MGATAPSRWHGGRDIDYVLPFENRGAEVGVTLHHPHGQIYAYPVVPPVPARMQEEAQLYYRKNARGVLAGSYRCGAARGFTHALRGATRCRFRSGMRPLSV